jgi:hypothetical protein
MDPVRCGGAGAVALVWARVVALAERRMRVATTR